MHRKRSASYIPITKSVGLVLGIATDHCDEGKPEKDKDENDLGKISSTVALCSAQYHLATTQPELCFSVSLYSKDVEKTMITSAVETRAQS